METRYLDRSVEKYEQFHVIFAGKNSVVVEATHKLLGKRFILKLVRPGASNNIRDSIRLLGEIGTEGTIVTPVDFLEVRTRDLVGAPVSLECLVFPLITGQTFRGISNPTKQSLELADRDCIRTSGGIGAIRIRET